MDASRAGDHVAADDGEQRASHDVFLSFAGADREAARELAGALRARGLRVFVDQDTIERFSSITSSIESALASSKTLMAYYSSVYAGRPACQRELTAAFLAGQREGNPLRRIMVMNPEAGSDHLQPIELADAKYAPYPIDPADLLRVADEVCAHVATVDSTIGEVRLADATNRYGLPQTGTSKFIGRQRELWALHSALHRARYPLVQDPLDGAAVSVCGLPGAGKTALLRAYATQYGAAFPGGIYWVDLSSTTRTTDALQKYSAEFRRMARMIGISTDGMSDDDLRTTFSGRIANPDRPSLWVIDGLPNNFDPACLDLIMPSESLAVRTALSSHETIFGPSLPVIEVGPLARADARALLSSHRLPKDEDLLALDGLVDRLGGHAGALDEAGHYLHDRPGLLSYSAYESAAANGAPPPGVTFAGMKQVFDRLTPDETSILLLATMCDAASVPIPLLAALDGGAVHDAGSALGLLRRRILARRVGDCWRVNPVVVGSIHLHSTPKIQGLYARLIDTVLELADRGAGDNSDRCLADLASRLTAGANSWQRRFEAPDLKFV
jgi:hypothetical protein